MDDTTRAILARIEGLGWSVSVRRLPGAVEIRAASSDQPGLSHAARRDERRGGDAACRCAWWLAVAVGIDVEDD